MQFSNAWAIKPQKKYQKINKSVLIVYLLINCLINKTSMHMTTHPKLEKYGAGKRL